MHALAGCSVPARGTSVFQTRCPPKPPWLQMTKYAIAFVLLITALTGCHLLEVQWVTADYPGGVEFIGVRKNEKSPITFFSVRVKGQNEGSISSACPLIFHWREQAVAVADITTSKLIAMNIETEPVDYLGPEWSSAFIGGADEQNTDYGVEFELKNDRIVEFYAHHNWRSSTACPFKLSFQGNLPVSFPLTEAQLNKAFGKPSHIIAVWGH